MTGPEHYREAERLLKEAHQPGRGGGCSAAEAYRLAQVHATLAQVAATMDLTGATVNGVVSPGWKAALS